MFTLSGPDRPVASLAFAPDNATLYAVQGAAGVHVWNLATRTGAGLVIDGQAVFGQFAVHPGGLWALGRCPKPELLLAPSANHSVVIDLRTGHMDPFNFSGVVGQHIAFSPDNRRLVTVGYSNYDPDRPAAPATPRLYGWDAGDDGPRYEWHLDTPRSGPQPWRVVFVGDDTLASEDWVPAGRSVVGSDLFTFRIAVRTARGAARLSLDLPGERVEQLLASPDGAQLVIRYGTALWAYDAADWGRPPRAVAGKHSKRLDGRAACFHPSRPYLLLANNGPSVVLFDTATWHEVHRWTWKAGTLRSVAVSADGTLAAAGSARGGVVVWDLDL